MPFARAEGGRRLYWESHGEGEPLLCVTGLGADSLAWALQIPDWSARLRTVCFDNRDVGRSDYVEDGYEIADMAADALLVADAAGLDTFHLLGASMGGAIAQEVALAAPERVRSLTLCMSWAGGGYWWRDRARVMANASLRTPHEEHVEQLLMQCLSEELYDDPDRVAELRRMALENPHPQRAEGFRRQVQALGRHDARDRLGRVRAPTHVIGAERDLMVPVWKSEQLAELIPGARLSVIERGTHAVNLERPQEFNALVLEFLARQERAQP